MSMICNFLRVTESELEDYLKDSSLLENRIYNEGQDDDNPVDIDKTWDGITFLLAGRNFAEAEAQLSGAIFSEQFVDEDQDLGYGPAHYLTAEQVADLNHEISAITVDALKLNFNPKEMTEIGVYPFIWEEGEDAFEYVADGFLTVQKVFADAAKNGEAIITFLD